ncbi:MAG: hypothetical protein AB7Q29_14960 [Vicinamibacterales bacterium]
MSGRPAKRREQIIAAGRRSLNEIAQFFIDCDYWNSQVRKPDEAPVDADPDGQLRRRFFGLQHMLRREDARPIPDATLPNTGATSIFHDHLDTCDICRARPFELCAIGVDLLAQATRSER